MLTNVPKIIFPIQAKQEGFKGEGVGNGASVARLVIRWFFYVKMTLNRLSASLVVALECSQT